MTVKMRLQLQILVLLFLISFTTLNKLAAQKSKLNKYGLFVIKDIRTLNASTKIDSEKKMNDIKKLIPNIIFDLRYATVNNFMKKKLYPEITTTYARYAAVKALQEVQIELNKQDLGLKIFDAYRPYSITENMWEPIKDERYVANPQNGSGHNRGIAIDLTIINLKTQQELLMGTGYDNFSDTAHQTFSALPTDVLNNRKKLKSLMEKNGFKALETEWWHYSLPNSKDYEILDLSFKKMQKVTRSN